MTSAAAVAVKTSACGPGAARRACCIGVANGLIDYLRLALRSQRLEFVEAPVPLLGGFDAAIYGFRLGQAPADFAGPLILRVLSDGDGRRARFEAAIQNALASTSYPAPRVLQVSGPTPGIGSSFLVMERLPGRHMMAELLRNPSLLLWLPSVLARMQARLHALDPQPLAEAVRAEKGAPFGTVEALLGPTRFHQIGDLDLRGLRPGLRWLQENQPRTREPVVCHGDFHPRNILMKNGKVTGVIDWSNLTLGDPEYEVGATLALLKYGRSGLPSVLEGAASWVRRAFVAGYYRAYRRLRRVDPEAIRYFEAMRCLRFLVEASERCLIDSGLLPPNSKRGMFERPRRAIGVIRRFREITGLTLSLPSEGLLGAPNDGVGGGARRHQLVWQSC
jgi:aminoglycoside phosphotransferase (APT) family kinase protein